MNLVFFIFCAFVIITPNIINAKILKYDNYTCYGSCCRWANKPSNYSDVLIEYSINFTVDEVIVTIWPENATKCEPKLYSFTTNKTGTSQSWKFSARDDFEYCFNAMKYGRENSSSQEPFTFSFGYENNAAKNQKIINDDETKKIDDTKKKLEINTNFTQIITNDKNKTTQYEENQDEFNNYNIKKNSTEIKNQTISSTGEIKVDGIVEIQKEKKNNNYVKPDKSFWDMVGRGWNDRFSLRP